MTPTGSWRTSSALVCGGLLLCAGWRPAVLAQAVYYVATNATPTAPYDTWATATTNLQTAIDAAVPGDTIYMAGHTFEVDAQIDWSTSGLTILGGYAATNVAETPGPHDPDRWPTVLTRTSARTRILYIHHLTNAVLRRVTVTGGYPVNATWGGGLYIDTAENLLIDACRIIDNRVYQNGNTAEYGAGIFSTGNSTVTMTNSLVRGNIGGGANNRGIIGGGIYIANGGWTLVNSRILGNRGSAGNLGKGGGMYFANGIHTLRNCLVAGNFAWHGSGLHVDNGTITVRHATIAQNMGVGVQRDGGSLTVSDSILWDNGMDVAGSVSLAYCSIMDGTSDGVNGCISADPRFERGFYLGAGSGSTNAGSMTAEAAGLDGYTTRADGTLDTDTVDMGYHYPAGLDSAVADLYVSPGGNDANAGTGWGAALRTVTHALGRARDGTRIHIAAGIYSTNTLETFPLEMNRAGLQLLGTNRAETVLQAPGIAGGGINRRVLTLNQVLGDGRIEGLTITGGRTDTTYGGGLMLDQSALTITDCQVSGNRARLNVYVGTSAGGGIYANQSSLVISNSMVRDNETYQNQANSSCSGGGLYAVGGRVSILDSVFRNNLSYNYMSSGSSFGGGMFLGHGRHRVFNSVVMNNAGHPTRLNTGGIYVSGGGNGGSVSIENTTVLGNIRHGITRNAGTVTVTNSIVWNNDQDIVGPLNLYSSNIEDGTGVGTNGCISADPLFERGLYLANGSPCRDAGGDMAVAVGLDSYTTSADGTPDSGMVDMGYHHRTGLDPALADLYVAPDGEDTNSGVDWTEAMRSITAALAKAQAGSRIHIASGNYTNGVETFPLLLDLPGIQLLGTNRNDTIISAAGANQRVAFVQGVTGDSRIEGVTLTGGYVPAVGGDNLGGGLYIENADLDMVSCIVSNNQLRQGGYQNQVNGGGIYALNSRLRLTDVYVLDNKTFHNQANSSSRGGGIATLYSDLQLVRSVLARNVIQVSGGNNLPYGGGLYAAGGTALLRNVLIAGNDRTGTTTGQGMGIYATACAIRLENCTVIDNNDAQSQGAIYQVGGEFWVTNSIVWGHNVDFGNFTHDALTLTRVHDTAISDGQNNGVQGCTNAEPEFVDRVYGHLKSRAGQYEGGYFTDGIWNADPLTNSPYIDAGRDGSAYTNEPQPNGRRLNWGAYGNTPVASKTFIREPGVFEDLTVHSYGPAAIGDKWVRLTGEILHDGGAGACQVFLCWDQADQGDGGLHAWRYVIPMGEYAAFDLFTNQVTGLWGTPHFRFFATNSAGGVFSSPADAVMLAQPPSVANTGATAVRRRSAILNGVITETGGVDPEAAFHLWESDSATTNILAAGVQSGSFQFAVSNLRPGATYRYRVMAGNPAGTAWSEDAEFVTIGVDPVAWYVATNGLATDGTNWNMAFPDFQLALDTAEPGDAIYLAGAQTFMPLPYYAFLWATSEITVEGGYEAADESPGARDPGQWETVLTRDPAGRSRVLTVQNVTNGLLRGVTVWNGRLPDGGTPQGGGIYVGNSVFTIDRCRIEENDAAQSAYQSYSEGGGIASVNSALTVLDSVIRRNKTDQVGNTNSKTHGAGIAVRGGSARIERCIIDGNRLRATHNSTAGYGSGVYLVNAIVDLVNVVVATNWMIGTSATGIGITGEGASSVVRLLHATVTGNTVEGIRRRNGILAVTNSIVWDHPVDLVGFPVDGDGALTTVGWTLIGDGQNDGTNGCFSADPLFIDPASGNYRLQSRYGRPGPVSGSWIHDPLTSPAIDTGLNLAWHSDAVDLDGRPRRVRGRFENQIAITDLGAYEQTARPRGSLITVR